MERRDLPPGRPIPQASALSRRGCRDLVMDGRAVCGTKLQHLATIRGGRASPSVTGLTIHDIVISP
jgi:hypothetical protein